MEKPNAEFLTDEQWLTMMKLVPDNITVQFSYPKAEGEPAILLRKGIRYVIQPDGSY